MQLTPLIKLKPTKLSFLLASPKALLTLMKLLKEANSHRVQAITTLKTLKKPTHVLL